MFYYKRNLIQIFQQAIPLSLLENGVYTRLMDVYHSTEKPISHKDRYRVTQAVTKKEKDAVDRILSSFFKKEGDVWMNDDAEKELSFYHEKAKTNKQNGMKGGRPNGQVVEFKR